MESTTSTKCNFENENKDELETMSSTSVNNSEVSSQQQQQQQQRQHPGSECEQSPKQTNDSSDGQSAEDDGDYVCDKAVQTLHPSTLTSLSNTLVTTASCNENHLRSPLPRITTLLPDASPNSALAARALSSLFHQDFHPPQSAQETTASSVSLGRLSSPRFVYPHPTPETWQSNPQQTSFAMKDPTLFPSKVNSDPINPMESIPHSSHIFPPKHDPFQESPASIHFAPPEGTPTYPTPYASRNPSPPNVLPKRLLSDEPRRFSSHPMVTPTPLKKPKLSPEEYSRKSKSLGLLCENFCQQTWEANIIGIDEAARALGVERRRIYDIINILESLHIVERECKNRYHWLGFDHLPRVLATIQQEGILGCPCLATEARNMGVLQPDEVIDTAGDDKPDQSVNTSGGQAKKSLGRLSRQYLQLFLVGHPVLSLTDASDRIMGKAEESSEAPPLSIASKAASDKKVALTKEQKTKIRRLYDIANVLASIGLVQKEDGERRARPIFSWVYTWKPQQIRELFRQDPSILYPSHITWRKNVGFKASKDGTKISPSEAKKRTSQVKSQPNPESQHQVLASIHQHGAREPEEKRQFEK